MGRRHYVGRKKVLRKQVLGYLVVVAVGDVPRHRVLSWNSGFTTWIWWMKILGGEVVSVCLYFEKMLFGFLLGRVGCRLEIWGT